MNNRAHPSQQLQEHHSEAVDVASVGQLVCHNVLRVEVALPWEGEPQAQQAQNDVGKGSLYVEFIFIYDIYLYISIYLYIYK